MQAHGQNTLLAIVAAVMSIVRWPKNESSPLLPVRDAPTSGANKEVEKANVQHRKKRGTHMMKFELKKPSTKLIFAKMSILLETLNILAANISRLTVHCWVLRWT